MTAAMQSTIPAICLRFVAASALFWFLANSSGCERDFMGRPSDGWPDQMTKS